jgi:molybdate transport system permease protein
MTGGALFLTDAEWAAVVLSLKVAACCVLLIAAPGVLVGWLLARRTFPGKTLLDAVVHLPLVLPPVAVGYILLILLGRQGLIGRGLESWLGVHVAFTWIAAVLAAAVMGFPLLVRSVRLAVELSDQRLEEAAATLGAGPVRRWLTVTVPLAAPGVLAGLILAFARSLGEFGATVIFAGNIPGQTRTLPLAVYTATQVPGGDGPALRLVVVAVLLSLAALVASELLVRRVRGALER